MFSCLFQGKTKDSYVEADDRNGLAEEEHRQRSDSPRRIAKFVRGPSPNDKKLDDIECKQDPYGDLMKKAMKNKSRSNSPATPRDSRESTPKLERIGRQSRLESNKTDKPGCTGPSLRTKQVTFMLFIITVVFILSFIPHLVLMVINSMNANFVKDMSPAGIAFYAICLRSFVINNMANPVIYGFCDKKFRSECSDFMWAFISCGRR